jgi:hypothetical protein
VVATCFSLAGCSSALFPGSVKWRSASLFNDRDISIGRYIPTMSLRLERDGTGYAEDIPKGHQKWSTNLCIDVDPQTVELYTGTIMWRKTSDYDFEISFPGYTYTVTDGPGKFVADWSEVRIWTCNPGPEYWTMHNVYGDPRKR